ncbi:MAG: alpha/beta fold hydrolase [Actinomycetota bacterium]
MAGKRFPLVDGRSTRVRATDVDLRVIVRGPTDSTRPTFLLVHGLASNARKWDGVGSRLASLDFPSVAVDLRGHGESDKPDQGYDFDTVCADLAGVLDELGVDRAVFVGQSWGGNIVVHAAHRRPDLVMGAVAVDGGIIELGRVFPRWDDCERRMAPPRLAGMRAGRLEGAIRATNGDWPESGIVGSLSNFEFLPDGTIRPHLSFERHMMILRELWAHRPSELFAEIERPLLFMPADSGDVSWTNDKERAVDHAIATARRARAHWFRPAHHDLHAQQPQRCADVLVENVENGFLS